MLGISLLKGKSACRFEISSVALVSEVVFHLFEHRLQFVAADAQGHAGGPIKQG
jgi:hypothetical protein